MFDPNNLNDIKSLVETIDCEYDEASVELFGSEHRNHLGASIIGDSCSRKIWYSFRWVKKPDFSSKSRTQGQVLRLFDRGHREEPSIIKILKKSGHRFDESKEEQFRIPKQVDGHFGGSLDGIGRLPEKFGFEHRILYEFKTSSTSEFRKLQKKGIKEHKPVHWYQMCTYGHQMNIDYGLYIVVNKDTDAMHFEFLKLNHELGKDMIQKAEMIIKSNDPPAKISMSPSHFVCKMCSFRDICHYDETKDKNCRSCKHCFAVEEGQWQCGKVEQIIPIDVIKVGCECYESV